MIEWVICPDCGKKLGKADTEKENTLILWCKGCKKEVEIKIGTHTTCVIKSTSDIPQDILNSVDSNKIVDFSELDFNKQIGGKNYEPNK